MTLSGAVLLIGSGLRQDLGHQLPPQMEGASARHAAQGCLTLQDHAAADDLVAEVPNAKDIAIGLTSKLEGLVERSPELTSRPYKTASTFYQGSSGC
jgi:hypothetical protein